MLGVVLAALSGLAYGASDFSGAWAARRASAMVVTAAAQAVSLVALVVLLVLVPPETVLMRDLAWGGLGGLGVAVGLTGLYKALAIGPMSTAAAVTSLVGALVPITFGLLLGDRPGPLALAGMGLAIPAVVLVSAGPGADRVVAPIPGVRIRRPLPGRRGTDPVSGPGSTRVLSVVAGLGFGLFFVALSRTSDGSGLFPLLGARGASIAALVTVISIGGNWRSVTGRSWLPIVMAGLGDCAANALYLTALDHGELSWVATIASLYPVTTVLLARVLLDERIGRLQAGGLALSGAALALVAFGR